MARVTFAIVDVQGSRARLRKRVDSGEKVEFKLEGYLDQAQNDDGTSQEYHAVVTRYVIDGE